MKLFTGVMVALVIFLVGLAIFLIVQADKECDAKGGEIVGTGMYTTTYVMSGKVMVPITSEIQECSK